MILAIFKPIVILYVSLAGVNVTVTDHSPKYATKEACEARLEEIMATVQNLNVPHHLLSKRCVKTPIVRSRAP